MHFGKIGDPDTWITGRTGTRYKSSGQSISDFLADQHKMTALKKPLAAVYQVGERACLPFDLMTVISEAQIESRAHQIWATGGADKDAPDDEKINWETAVRQLKQEWHAKLSTPAETQPTAAYLGDSLIYHAEDDQGVGQALAAQLSKCGFTVWRDASMVCLPILIKNGADNGLTPRLDIVLFSHNSANNFAALNGQKNNSASLMVPVWHDIGSSQESQAGPLVAEKCPVTTSNGIENTVTEIMRIFIAQKRRYWLAALGWQCCALTHSSCPEAQGAVITQLTPLAHALRILRLDESLPRCPAKLVDLIGRRTKTRHPALFGAFALGLLAPFLNTGYQDKTYRIQLQQWYQETHSKKAPQVQLNQLWQMGATDDYTASYTAMLTLAETGKITPTTT